MKTLKIGIIGTGGIAQYAHIPGYQKIEGVEVAAVCDIDEEKAKEAANKFGIPKVFTDYRDLLAMEEIDAVSVATPNFMHKEPVVAAFEAGKHVLCEKPIAMNAQEGAEMVEASRKAKKKFMVNFQHRFSSGSQALKRFIESGELGEIYFAESLSLRRRGIPGWGLFTEKSKSGGGPLIDIGVHILDATLWFMGHPKPITVSGCTYTKFGTREGVLGLMGQWDPKKFDVEDYGAGFIRFENGASLILQASFCANIEKDVFTCRLLGTEGGADLMPLQIYREEGGCLTITTPQSLPQVNSYDLSVRAFIESIRNDTDPPITGDQALMVTKIIDGIYKSAELGREVEIV